MPKLLLLLVFVFYLNSNSFSQKFTNVEISQDGNVILVKYDLINCAEQTLYDIGLKFVDSKKNPIFPKTISGDYKRVSQGLNKVIKWDVIGDNIEISDNIQAILEITQSYSTKIKGGPSNALLSVLIPGLGDVFVNNNSEPTIRPIYVTVATAGMLIFGYSSKQESNFYYNQYKNATTQLEMDELYTKANDLQHTYLICASTGLLIWLADIGYVAYQGSQNKKSQQRKFSSLNKQYYFSAIPNGMKINLRLTF